MLIKEEELERRAAELRGRLKEWEWGYLVGLIEGEGSLSIDKDKKWYYPRIDVSNTNLKVLRKFHLKLGIGSICLNRHNKERELEAYTWTIFGYNCIILLKIIVKLLFSCKRTKAALLIALNKVNYGPYAEKIKSRIKYLNNNEEDLIMIDKEINNTEFFIKNNISDFELGVIAGLLDAEGAIQITTPSSLRVEIASTCPRIINKILNLVIGWGVYIMDHPPRRKLFQLRLYNKKAETLLKFIKEFLIIKKDRAEIALKFAETLGQPGHRPPASIKKLREKLYWELRALNQRGTSRYGSTVLAPASHIPRGIEWSLPRPLLSIDI